MCNMSEPKAGRKREHSTCSIHELLSEMQAGVRTLAESNKTWLVHKLIEWFLGKKQDIIHTELKLGKKRLSWNARNAH